MTHGTHGIPPQQITFQEKVIRQHSPSKSTCVSLNIFSAKISVTLEFMNLGVEALS